MKKIIFTSIALLLSCTIILFSANKQPEENKIIYEDIKNTFDSSLFTQKDDEITYIQDEIDNTNFQERIKNDKLILYSNTQTGAIRILNKETGFLWCSDVYNLDSYPEFGIPIRNRLVSAFRILYRKADGAVKDAYAKDATINESIINNTLNVMVKIKSADISFKYSITLKENKINVLLDHESITENENRLTSITLFPYLGSAYKDNIPGYFFLPSGSGALVRLNATSPIVASYVTPFYGTNANITQNKESEILSFPVYGIVQGIKQNGIFVNIKEGDAFASLTYTPANVEPGFNMIYPVFNYRETYTFKIPGSEEILIVPDGIYHNNIELEYTILSGDEASYVGMAKSYQKDLIDENVLSRNNTNKENISVHVDVFGKDYESGLIFNINHKMTTTNDLIKINNDLKNRGLENITYTLRAFNKGGYSNQKVQNIRFDNSLGSLNDLESLDYYYTYNPIVSYNSKKRFPNNVLVNLYNEKSYVMIETNKYKFYSNVSSISEYTTKALKKFTKLALDGIGYTLYGDNNNDYTRNDVMNIYKELLGNNKLPMYTPNAYLLKNTSIYLNMPIYASRFRFITDSIPFTEILLKGYITYYTPFLNFSSNRSIDILRCIEYGCNPAYLITSEPSYLLSRCLSSNYYATYYDSLKEIIEGEYMYLNNALKQVYTSLIINHEVITPGINKVTYDNDVSIYVNYTDYDYSIGDYIIKSNDYLCVKGDQYE